MKSKQLKKVIRNLETQIRNLKNPETNAEKRKFPIWQESLSNIVAVMWMSLKSEE